MTIGKSVFSETPLDGDHLEAGSSQMRKEDRTRMDSGQVGYSELSGGYGS